MNIDINDLLTLNDNKEYVVVSKANYEGSNYYYLIDKDSPENVMFCYEDGNELVEIEDKDLTAKIIPLLLEPIQI